MHEPAPFLKKLQSGTCVLEHPPPLRQVPLIQNRQSFQNSYQMVLGYRLFRMGWMGPLAELPRGLDLAESFDGGKGS